MGCLADVAALLTRRAGSLPQALREMHGMVIKAIALLQDQCEQQGKTRKKLQRCEKKLCFLLSFAHYHEDLLIPFAGEVEAFRARREAATQEGKDVDNKLRNDGI